MTLPAKLLTGVAAIATTAVGGIGIHKWNEPRNIKEALIQNGKTPLNIETERTNDQEEWDKITKDSSLKEGLKSFLGISGDEELSSKVKELKEKCKEKFSIEKGNKDFSKFLEEAEKYCTKRAT